MKVDPETGARYAHTPEEWAAELGLAAAQVNLAGCYMGGVGVAVNRTLGLLWLRRAAVLGSNVAVDLLEKLGEPIEGDSTDVPPTRNLH